MQESKSSRSIIPSNHSRLMNHLEQAKWNGSMRNRRPYVQPGACKSSCDRITRERLLCPGPEHGVTGLTETGEIVQHPTSNTTAKPGVVLDNLDTALTAIEELAETPLFAQLVANCKRLTFARLPYKLSCGKPNSFELVQFSSMDSLSQQPRTSPKSQRHSSILNHTKRWDCLASEALLDTI